MTVTKTMLDAIAEHTVLSVDSMWPEGSLAIKPAKYFDNATSNQFHIWYMFNKKPELIQEAIACVKKFTAVKESDKEEFIQEVINYAAALLGKGMLEVVSGHCLTQTNPSFAYDTTKTVASAVAFMKAYEDLGVPKDKVIIKIPTTFEGLKAIQELTTVYGIKTLGTMIHSLPQAIAAAEAGAFAISTYVDELAANLDTSLLKEYDDLEENYGWALTRDVHYYYRAYGVKTLNVAAAMIGAGVTIGLAGIDGMTIPIPCLEMLAKMPAPVDFKPRMPKVVTPEEAPAKETYVDDKEKFNTAVFSNKMAKFRIEDAIATFVEYDGRTRKMIADVL
ncbi:uncharacterized protein V1518DRAFT_214568 [Limtongia smithiae]|uniref:uncharacterized protein n=1 Tax=Limtongia smithiae TaxID=1125753 RepID=UPI0034CF6E73